MDEERVTAADGVPPGRMVGFSQSVSLFFRNYVDFEGRSSRGAYWYWALAMLLLSIVTMTLDAILFPAQVDAWEGSGPIDFALTLVTVIPTISLGVRRLHDIGRTGWWSLIALTIIGLLLLVYWACLPGERRENRFGPDAEAGHRP